MTGNYWILRHPLLPGKVCVIAEADVDETPMLLDLPPGMTYENIELVNLEEFMEKIL